MEQENAALDLYYEELDPERRLRLLEEGNCGSRAELCRRLWELRYTDPKDKARRVDLFLWQIVNLLSIYKLARFSIARKSCVKEAKAAMEALGSAIAAEYGGENELYRELRNAMRRYFGTCSGRSYGKKLFGMVPINDDERLDKIAAEAWQLAEGLPERLGLWDALEPLSRAARDEYLSIYGGTRWEKRSMSRLSA